MAVLQKTKASSTSVSQQTKSNWRAPMSDFIVSDDDDVDKSDSDIDSDVELVDDVLTSDKENQPYCQLPEGSDEATYKSKLPINSDATSVGCDNFLKPGNIQQNQ